MQIPVLEPALDTVISGRYAQLDLWAATTAGDRREGLRALREVGLEALAERSWMHLSQGERQRVLIARARMARPSLLILDEPCAGLDPVARSRFLAEVESLARRPKAPALVLVTHHVEEITPAFTHVLLLSEGRVLAAGPRERVLTSRRLSEAFSAPVRLRRSRRGLQLAVG
jgi:iron complex transport system ATP-binding protein